MTEATVSAEAVAVVQVVELVLETFSPRGVLPERVGFLHVAAGSQDDAAGGGLVQVGFGELLPEAGESAEHDDPRPGGGGGI